LPFCTPLLSRTVAMAFHSRILCLHVSALLLGATGQGEMPDMGGMDMGGMGDMMGGMGGMGDMMGGMGGGMPGMDGGNGPPSPPPPPPMQIATKTAKKLVKELRSVLTRTKNAEEIKAFMEEAKAKGEGEGKEEMDKFTNLIATLTDPIGEKYGFKGGFGEMLGSIKQAADRKHNEVLQKGYAEILKAVGAPPPPEDNEAGMDEDAGDAPGAEDGSAKTEL